MTRMFWIDGSVKSEPAIDRWLTEQPAGLRTIAAHWFECMRGCGDDVWEAMHDGRPVACLDKFPFAYVSVFTRHVNVGFFLGAELDDPAGLLEGSGKFMRHVKVKPDEPRDEDALAGLIHAAYRDMRQRVAGTVQRD